MGKAISKSGLRGRSILLFCFSLTLVCFVSYIYIGSVKQNQRVASIEQIAAQFQAEQIEGSREKSRPLPKEIFLVPTFKASWHQKNTKFSLGGEDEVERMKYALRISKEDGFYVWSSNNNKKLYEVTNHVTQAGSFPRDITKLVAMDGSGLIVIKHDGYYVKGSCHYPKARLASYREYRFDERITLGGQTMFFPPRPDDWCETLETKLRKKLDD